MTFGLGGVGLVDSCYLVTTGYLPTASQAQTFGVGGVVVGLLLGGLLNWYVLVRSSLK